MEEQEFNKRLQEAKDRVDGFDRVDNFKDRYLSTILIALESGIKNPNTNSHFDALFMLKDLVDSKILEKYEGWGDKAYHIMLPKELK